MFVLNVYFYCELRFVANYAPNSDFYSETQELTQILLRISEEKIGGWGLWSMFCSYVSGYIRLDCLLQVGMAPGDVDLWEINEAFSVVVLANMKLDNLDHDK